MPFKPKVTVKGLFGKREPMPAAPVDRKRVMRLVQAHMAEIDAEGSPGGAEASRRLSDAVQGSTQAERRAARDALRRHGY